MSKVECIDVSSHNGNLDWDTIKADGVVCACLLYTSDAADE